jgi:hypothetical protein
MFSKTLFRLIAVPLTLLALALTFAVPATAGGGDGGGSGPSVSLTPPSVAYDGQGGVIATMTLTCWGDAVTEGHEGIVIVSIGLGQHGAGGGASLETTCDDEPQVLTMPITSQTGQAFRPGPVSGMIEWYAYTSTSAGQAIGEIDQVLKPVQANR